MDQVVALRLREGILVDSKFEQDAEEGCQMEERTAGETENSKVSEGRRYG